MRTGSSLEPIVETITQRIASGEYGPGKRLPTESELQKEWGVSRSVVREAMKVLDSRGLVNVRQGSGTFVNEANHAALQTHLEITLQRAGCDSKTEHPCDEIDYLMDMRTVLESAAAERAACSASMEDIGNMESTLDAMRDALGDTDACTAADLLFHRILACSTGNPLWPAMLDSMNQVLNRLQETAHLKREYAPQTACEHEAIVQAIRARDSVAAATAMRRHLASSSEGLRLARRKNRVSQPEDRI